MIECVTDLPPDDRPSEGMEFFAGEDTEFDDDELQRIMPYDDPGDCGPEAGVREPRRPGPRSGSGAATQATDDT